MTAFTDSRGKTEDDAVQSTYMNAVKAPTSRCTQRPFDRLRERAFFDDGVFVLGWRSSI